MKLLAVIALVLPVLGCTAQPLPPAVEQASSIYQSCLVGFTIANGWPQSKKEILQLAKDLDPVCTQWSEAWLPGFLGRSLTFRETQQFTIQRRAILQVYAEELDKLPRQ